MEIINAVIDGWFHEIDKIKDHINEYQTEHNGNIQKIQSIDMDRDSTVSEHDNTSKMIADIYEFMGYIGVSKDKLPYKPKELDKDELVGFDEKQDEIREDDLFVREEIDMYQRYLDSLNIIKNSWGKMLNNREKTNHYISGYEFVEDIYILTLSAAEKYNDTSRNINEYTSYLDILELYTVDNLKKAGHPLDDEALDDGNAELIAAVCRASWEYCYLKNLADWVNHCAEIKFRSMLRNIKKKEKDNPIIQAWKKDTLAIAKTDYKDSPFYLYYKDLLTDSELEKVNFFIGKI